MSMFSWLRLFFLLFMFPFSDAMFHKRARRTRTQEPGADRMRDYFEEMFLSNQLSAEEVRDMFEDGAALNMHGMKNFAKAGNFGKHRQNVARDMLRKSIKKNKMAGHLCILLLFLHMTLVHKLENLSSCHCFSLMKSYTAFQSETTVKLS